MDIVLGTCSWQTGCYSNSGGGCTGDKIDVSGGRVVVRVYRMGGRAPGCGPGPTPNAILGSNAVLASTTGSMTTWGLREPGGQFGRVNNIFVEAHTDGSVGVASAEALVASFRWAPGVNSGYCLPVDTSSPSPQ